MCGELKTPVFGSMPRTTSFRRCMHLDMRSRSTRSAVGGPAVMSADLYIYICIRLMCGGYCMSGRPIARRVSCNISNITFNLSRVSPRRPAASCRPSSESFSLRPGAHDKLPPARSRGVPWRTFRDVSIPKNTVSNPYQTRIKPVSNPYQTRIKLYQTRIKLYQTVSHERVPRVNCVQATNERPRNRSSGLGGNPHRGGD